MEAIKMDDGDIKFSTISGIDEFWQRVKKMINGKMSKKRKL